MAYPMDWWPVFNLECCWTCSVRCSTVWPYLGDGIPEMATVVYRLLSSMALAYLAAECRLVLEEGRRSLHSVDSRTCVIARSYSNFGDWCFVAAGPKLWNSLPPGLRETSIGYGQCNWRPKTFLFACQDCGALRLIVILCPRNFLSYLLTY